MPEKPGPKKGSRLKDTHTHPFGQAMSRLRKKKALTQGELAEKMGTSIRMISYYERAMKNPEISTIERIAKALEVSPEFFLKSEKPKAPQGPVVGRALQRKLNLVAQLPDEDQKYIARTIDMLAEKNRLK